MSNDTFELLQKYDDKFILLYNGATQVRYVTMQMQIDCGIAYSEVFGRTPAKSEFNCSHCAFKIYKELAFKYVEEKNNRLAEAKPTKKTRKKKNDKEE